MAKKLKNIKINWISLTANPANGKDFIFKSMNAKDSNNSHLQSISIKKSNTEKHLIYAVIYEPETVDGQGDFAEAEEIEKAAHGFMADYCQYMVDTEHDFNNNRSVVVESFIVKGIHPDFPEVKSGSWCAVIKINDVEIWEKVKSGELTGVSMAGYAEKETVEKNINDFIKSFGVEEKGMNEEIKKALEKQAEEFTKRLDKLDGDFGKAKEENESLKKSLGSLTDENKALKEKLETLEKASPGRKSDGSSDSSEEEEMSIL